MPAKPIQKKSTTKKPNVGTDYDRTWIPKVYSIPKVKTKTKTAPIPKASLKGINEIKQPKTKRA